MRPKFPTIIAAAALALNPLGALADTGGQTIELRIQATGEVAPDRIEAVVTVIGYGKTNGEAEAQMHAGEQAVIESLTQQGVERSRIKIKASSAGPMMPVAMVATPAPPMIAPPPPPAPPKGEKKAPIATVNIASPPPPAVVPAARYEPPLYAQSQITVALDSPEQLQKLQSVRSNGSLQVGYRFTVDARYAVGDLAKARREARVKAIAKARAEADDYAAALGYHVVRIVRASNAKPGVSMDDVIGFAGMVDRRAGGDPKALLASVRESVTIDFELAPN